jgi:hypothetical protein
MSIAPLAAGRYSIRGSRLTTHNVEERFRLEGPGQAAEESLQKDRPPGYAAGLATMRRQRWKVGTKARLSLRSRFN